VRRGFKAEAERLSLAERKALGLTDRSRLEPVRLAEAKGVPVVPLNALPGISAAHLERLRVIDPGAFSAAAVVDGGDALIVVNDAHEPARQANSISHELAHLLLGHEPARSFDPFGARNITKEMEDEADWLAGCLLVPKSGIAVTMSEAGGRLEVAADHYGVSVQLMRWRVNMTQPRRRRNLGERPTERRGGCNVSA
jgi:Zn-dependent peptidase ImmA (M78 family)